MFLSKQISNIGLCLTRGRHNGNDKYFISQSQFHLPKILFVITQIQFFKQILRDFILLLHDIAGLDMTLQEWKQLCRKAWENEYDYLKVD